MSMVALIGQPVIIFRAKRRVQGAEFERQLCVILNAFDHLA